MEAGKFGSYLALLAFAMSMFSFGGHAMEHSVEQARQIAAKERKVIEEWKQSELNRLEAQGISNKEEHDKRMRAIQDKASADFQALSDRLKLSQKGHETAMAETMARVNKGTDCLATLTNCRNSSQETLKQCRASGKPLMECVKAQQTEDQKCKSAFDACTEKAE